MLWLLRNEQAEGNLRREAMQRGIAPQRLVFAPDLPQAEHLARLQLADLVLDTLPYNAHTTASDALWAGVPLVTLRRRHLCLARGGQPAACGGPARAGHAQPERLRRARARAGGRPSRLQALRARLARQRLAAPLFDVAGYTRGLEALYAEMWARHCDGLPPQALGAGV